MKSSLFTQDNVERQTEELFANQNDYVLRARLTPGRRLNAMKGTMLAYQGDVTMKHRGSASAKEFFKKAVSSDDIPMMTVEGDGEIFIGDGGSKVHIIHLEGESIVINGRNLLAFEGTLDYDLKRNGITGMLSGGVWNTRVTGHGALAVRTGPGATILETTQPTCTDIDNTIAWAGHMTPGITTSMRAGDLIGRDSGEKFQYTFPQPGWVIVA